MQCHIEDTKGSFTSVRGSFVLIQEQGGKWSGSNDTPPRDSAVNEIELRPLLYGDLTARPARDNALVLKHEENGILC